MFSARSRLATPEVLQRLLADERMIPDSTHWELQRKRHNWVSRHVAEQIVAGLRGGLPRQRNAPLILPETLNITALYAPGRANGTPVHTTSTGPAAQDRIFVQRRDSK